MRITWISAGAITRNDGELDSPLASVRYRMLAPARFLARWGHEIRLASSAWPAESPDWKRALESETLIVGKVFGPGLIPIVERALRLGRRVVLDICDDHFETPQLGAAYRRLCELASEITASTPAMAEAIALRTGRKSTVIDDPFEAPLGEPRFAPGERIEALWFGHPVNFDTCLAMLPELSRFSARRALRLHVITQSMNGAAPAQLGQLKASHSPAFEIRFTPWSQEATWQGIAEADVVLAPSSTAATKWVKSPNRVIEAIRLGRFVVAYPLPSYLSLSAFVAISEEMTPGLDWALAHPSEALARIVAGQAYIQQRFSPERVARLWQSLLLRQPAPALSDRGTSPTVSPSATGNPLNMAGLLQPPHASLGGPYGGSTAATPFNSHAAGDRG